MSFIVEQLTLFHTFSGNYIPVQKERMFYLCFSVRSSVCLSVRPNIVALFLSNFKLQGHFYTFFTQVCLMVDFFCNNPHQVTTFCIFGLSFGTNFQQCFLESCSTQNYIHATKSNWSPGTWISASIYLKEEELVNKFAKNLMCNFKRSDMHFKICKYINTVRKDYIINTTCCILKREHIELSSMVNYVTLKHVCLK